MPEISIPKFLDQVSEFLGIFGTVFGQFVLNFGTVFGQFRLKFRDCFWNVRTGFSKKISSVLGLYGNPIESRIWPYACEWHLGTHIF